MTYRSRSALLEDRPSFPSSRRQARAILQALLAVAIAFGCAPRALGPVVRDGRGGAPTDMPDVARRVTRVEMGQQVAASSLEASWLGKRMQGARTPSVSIAVINHGAIEWAHGYGVLAQGETVTTPETMFQAASLSKVVTAFLALRLVDRKQLSLDEDVNLGLRSWQVPPTELTQQKKVTLRAILSHSSGLDVEGFNGYEPGESLPSLRQILDGTPPANSAPLRVTFMPGSQQHYSGGGFVVLQQLITDVMQAPFEQTMNQLVFGPLEMNHSVFAAQLPAGQAQNAARGHDKEGSALRGHGHLYPELAAAGLWTTPTDLARLALALTPARAGQSSGLSQASAELMTTRQLGSYALGFYVLGESENRAIGHAGANAGFRCSMVLFPTRGQGAVVMTNGDGGGALARDVLHAIGQVYGWPQVAPEHAQ